VSSEIRLPKELLYVLDINFKSLKQTKPDENTLLSIKSDPGNSFNWGCMSRYSQLVLPFGAPNVKTIIVAASEDPVRKVTKIMENIYRVFKTNYVALMKLLL
jgi:hypothetical protein